MLGVRLFLLPGLLFTLCGALAGQSNFEVASVKASLLLPGGNYGNYRMSGGPGTSSPGRMILENFDLFSLVLKAFDIPAFLLLAPEWTHEIRFDISANVPRGTTKDQFLLMQQDLLASRFALSVHREKKDMSAYELVVDKGGAKFSTENVIASEDDIASSRGPLKSDKDNFPILPPGRTGYAIAYNRASFQGVGETMDHFCSVLAGQLQTSVIDSTGLSGSYNFTLRWIPSTSISDDDSGGLNLKGALRKQLGLVLRKTRKPVEILVVDHVEKTPTGN